MAMQGGIVPGEAEVVNQALQSGDRRLGDLRKLGLISWVAEVDPATHRTGVAGGTSSLEVLPRAGLPLVERPAGRRCVGQEQGDLGCRGE